MIEYKPEIERALKYQRRYADGTPLNSSSFRQEQEGYVFNAMTKRTPVLIRGLSKIGKTTMAMSILSKNFPDSGMFTSFLYTTSDLSSFEKYMKKSVVKFIFERYGKTVDIKDESLAFLDEYLGEKKETVALCVDEIVRVYRGSEDKLNANNLSELLSSFRRLDNIRVLGILHYIGEAAETEIKTFSNGYENIFPRPFSPKENRVFLNEPIADTKLSIDDDAIKRIEELSGSLPYVTSKIYEETLRNLIRHKSFNGEIKREHVNTPDFERLFFGWCNQLDEPQREDLVDISKNIPPKKDVSDLVKIRLVKESAGEYTVNGLLLEHFLKKL